VEKPDKARAKGFVESGDYFWNSGMFLLPARAYLEELGRLDPAMLGACRKAFESAAIDGASPSTSFFRLALPMSVPALASLIIFQFLWVWNDLLVALVYLGGASENHPLSVVLANLTTSFGGGWQFLTAAAFVSMIVPIIVFLSLQRYFVRGLLAGSVKG